MWGLRKKGEINIYASLHWLLRGDKILNKIDYTQNKIKKQQIRLKYKYMLEQLVKHEFKFSRKRIELAQGRLSFLFGGGG